MSCGGVYYYPGNPALSTFFSAPYLNLRSGSSNNAAGTWIQTKFADLNSQQFDIIWSENIVSSMKLYENINQGNYNPTQSSDTLVRTTGIIVGEEFCLNVTLTPSFMQFIQSLADLKVKYTFLDAGSNIVGPAYTLANASYSALIGRNLYIYQLLTGISPSAITQISVSVSDRQNLHFGYYSLAINVINAPSIQEAIYFYNGSRMMSEDITANSVYISTLPENLNGLPVYFKMASNYSNAPINYWSFTVSLWTRDSPPPATPYVQDDSSRIETYLGGYVKISQPLPPNGALRLNIIKPTLDINLRVVKYDGANYIDYSGINGVDPYITITPNKNFGDYYFKIKVTDPARTGTIPFVFDPANGLFPGIEVVRNIIISSSLQTVNLGNFAFNPDNNTILIPFPSLLDGGGNLLGGNYYNTLINLDFFLVYHQGTVQNYIYQDFLKASYPDFKIKRNMIVDAIFDTTTNPTTDTITGNTIQLYMNPVGANTYPLTLNLRVKDPDGKVVSASLDAHVTDNLLKVYQHNPSVNTSQITSVTGTPYYNNGVLTVASNAIIAQKLASSASADYILLMPYITNIDSTTSQQIIDFAFSFDLGGYLSSHSLNRSSLAGLQCFFNASAYCNGITVPSQNIELQYLNTQGSWSTILDSNELLYTGTPDLGNVAFHKNNILLTSTDLITPGSSLGIIQFRYQIYYTGPSSGTPWNIGVQTNQLNSMIALYLSTMKFQVITINNPSIVVPTQYPSTITYNAGTEATFNVPGFTAPNSVTNPYYFIVDSVSPVDTTYYTSEDFVVNYIQRNAGNVEIPISTDRFYLDVALRPTQIAGLTVTTSTGTLTTPATVPFDLQATVMDSLTGSGAANAYVEFYYVESSIEHSLGIAVTGSDGVARFHDALLPSIGTHVLMARVVENDGTVNSGYISPSDLLGNNQYFYGDRYAQSICTGPTINVTRSSTGIVIYTIPQDLTSLVSNSKFPISFDLLDTSADVPISNISLTVTVNGMPLTGVISYNQVLLDFTNPGTYTITAILPAGQEDLFAGCTASKTFTVYRTKTSMISQQETANPGQQENFLARIQDLTNFTGISGMLVDFYFSTSDPSLTAVWITIGQSRTNSTGFADLTSWTVPDTLAGTLIYIIAECDPEGNIAYDISNGYTPLEITKIGTVINFVLNGNANPGNYTSTAYPLDDLAFQISVFDTMNQSFLQNKPVTIYIYSSCCKFKTYYLDSMETQTTPITWHFTPSIAQFYRIVIEHEQTTQFSYSKAQYDFLIILKPTELNVTMGSQFYRIGYNFSFTIALYFKDTSHLLNGAAINVARTAPNGTIYQFSFLLGITPLERTFIWQPLTAGLFTFDFIFIGNGTYKSASTQITITISPRVIDMENFAITGNGDLRINQELQISFVLADNDSVNKNPIPGIDVIFSIALVKQPENPIFSKYLVSAVNGSVLFKWLIPTQLLNKQLNVSIYIYGDSLTNGVLYESYILNYVINVNPMKTILNVTLDPLFENVMQERTYLNITLADEASTVLVGEPVTINVIDMGSGTSIFPVPQTLTILHPINQYFFEFPFLGKYNMTVTFTNSTPYYQNTTFSKIIDIFKRNMLITNNLTLTIDASKPLNIAIAVTDLLNGSAIKSKEIDVGYYTPVSGQPVKIGTYITNGTGQFVAKNIDLPAIFLTRSNITFYFNGTDNNFYDIVYYNYFVAISKARIILKISYMQNITQVFIETDLEFRLDVLRVSDRGIIDGVNISYQITSPSGIIIKTGIISSGNASMIAFSLAANGFYIIQATFAETNNYLGSSEDFYVYARLFTSAFDMPVVIESPLEIGKSYTFRLRDIVHGVIIPNAPVTITVQNSNRHTFSTFSGKTDSYGVLTFTWTPSLMLNGTSVCLYLFYAGNKTIDGTEFWTKYYAFQAIAPKKPAIISIKILEALTRNVTWGFLGRKCNYTIPDIYKNLTIVVTVSMPGVNTTGILVDIVILSQKGNEKILYTGITNATGQVSYIWQRPHPDNLWEYFQSIALIARIDYNDTRFLPEQSDPIYISIRRIFTELSMNCFDKVMIGFNLTTNITLFNEMGLCVSGETIHVKILEKVNNLFNNVNSFDVTSGVDSSSIILQFNHLGTFEIKASYAGNNLYFGSSNSQSVQVINIEPVFISITLTPSQNITTLTRVNVTINAVDSAGKLLKGLHITVSLKCYIYYVWINRTVIIGVNNSFAWTPSEKGAYQFACSYLGNSTYSAAQKKSAIILVDEAHFTPLNWVMLLFMMACGFVFTPSTIKRHSSKHRRYFIACAILLLAMVVSAETVTSLSTGKNMSAGDIINKVSVLNYSLKNDIAPGQDQATNMINQLYSMNEPVVAPVTVFAIKQLNIALNQSGLIDPSLSKTSTEVNKLADKFYFNANSTVNQTADVTPPEIKILQPSKDQVIQNNLVIEAEIKDSYSGVQRAIFTLQRILDNGEYDNVYNGILQLDEDLGLNHYSATINVTAFVDSNYVVTINATDLDGNYRATSQQFSIKNQISVDKSKLTSMTMFKAELTTAVNLSFSSEARGSYFVIILDNAGNPVAPAKSGIINPNVPLSILMYIDPGYFSVGNYDLRIQVTTDLGKIWAEDYVLAISKKGVSINLSFKGMGYGNNIYTNNYFTLFANLTSTVMQPGSTDKIMLYNPLIAEFVDFYIYYDNQWLYLGSSLTNASGIARYDFAFNDFTPVQSYILNQKGKYVFEARFRGSNVYLPQTTDTIIENNGIMTIIDDLSLNLYSKMVVRYTDSLSLSVEIFESTIPGYSRALSGTEIDFNLVDQDGHEMYIGSGISDAGGKVSILYAATAAPGIYSLKCMFSGNSTLANASKTFYNEIEIDPESVMVDFTNMPSTVTYNESFTINVILKESGVGTAYNPINGQVISLYLVNKTTSGLTDLNITLGTITTDLAGLGALDTIINQSMAGVIPEKNLNIDPLHGEFSYEIEAYFKGNENLSSSTKFQYFKFQRMQPNIQVNMTSFKFEDSITMRARAVDSFNLPIPNMNLEMTICGQQVTSTTDQFGFATFIFNPFTPPLVVGKYDVVVEILNTNEWFAASTIAFAKHLEITKIDSHLLPNISDKNSAILSIPVSLTLTDEIGNPIQIINDAQAISITVSDAALGIAVDDLQDVKTNAIGQWSGALKPEPVGAYILKVIFIGNTNCNPSEVAVNFEVVPVLADLKLIAINGYSFHKNDEVDFSITSANPLSQNQQLPLQILVNGTIVKTLRTLGIGTPTDISWQIPSSFGAGQFNLTTRIDSTLSDFKGQVTTIIDVRSRPSLTIQTQRVNTEYNPSEHYVNERESFTVSLRDEDGNVLPDQFKLFNTSFYVFDNTINVTCDQNGTHYSTWEGDTVTTNGNLVQIFSPRPFITVKNTETQYIVARYAGDRFHDACFAILPLEIHRRPVELNITSITHDNPDRPWNVIHEGDTLTIQGNATDILNSSSAALDTLDVNNLIIDLYVDGQQIPYQAILWTGNGNFVITLTVDSLSKSLMKAGAHVVEIRYAGGTTFDSSQYQFDQALMTIEYYTVDATLTGGELGALHDTLNVNVEIKVDGKIVPDAFIYMTVGDQDNNTLFSDWATSGSYSISISKPGTYSVYLDYNNTWWEGTDAQPYFVSDLTDNPPTTHTMYVNPTTSITISKKVAVTENNIAIVAIPVFLSSLVDEMIVAAAFLGATMSEIIMLYIIWWALQLSVYISTLTNGILSILLMFMWNWITSILGLTGVTLESVLLGKSSSSKLDSFVCTIYQTNCLENVYYDLNFGSNSTSSSRAEVVPSKTGKESVDSKSDLITIEAFGPGYGAGTMSSGEIVKNLKKLLSIITLVSIILIALKAIVDLWENSYKASGGSDYVTLLLIDMLISAIVGAFMALVFIAKFNFDLPTSLIIAIMVASIAASVIRSLIFLIIYLTTGVTYDQMDWFTRMIWDCIITAIQIFLTAVVVYAVIVSGTGVSAEISTQILKQVLISILSVILTPLITLLVRTIIVSIMPAATSVGTVPIETQITLRNLVCDQYYFTKQMIKLPQYLPAAMVNFFLHIDWTKLCGGLTTAEIYSLAAAVAQYYWTIYISTFGSTEMAGVLAGMLKAEENGWEILWVGLKKLQDVADYLIQKNLISPRQYEQLSKLADNMGNSHGPDLIAKTPTGQPVIGEMKGTSWGWDWYRLFKLVGGLWVWQPLYSWLIQSYNGDPSWLAPIKAFCSDAYEILKDILENGNFVNVLAAIIICAIGSPINLIDNAAFNLLYNAAAALGQTLDIETISIENDYNPATPSISVALPPM